MKTIAFSITSRCEEECSYCFRSPQHDTGVKEFEGLLARALQDNQGLSKVVITGGNPELNPHFWEICGVVKARGLKLKVHSNYSSKKNWKKYVSIADEVTIPIDSLEENQPFRSEKSAKNFRAAFDYFLKNKVPIQVHTVVGRPNLLKTIKIHDFLKSKGFFLPGPNSWKLFRLVSQSNGGGGNDIGNGDDGEALELSDKEWFEVKKRFEGKNVRFVDNVLEY